MTVAAVEAVPFGLGHLAAAARDRDHELLVLVEDRSRYGYDLARGVPDGVTLIEIDTTDVDAMAGLLEDVEDLAGVVRLTDHRGRQALALARRLSLPHEDPEAVDLLESKARLRAHLYEHGFSRSAGHVFNPFEVVPGDLATLPFPCVIKDVHGRESRNVWVVDRPADLDRALVAMRTADLESGTLVAEPYFVGPLYSAETVAWAGSTRVLGITSHGVTPRPGVRAETTSFPVALPADEMEIVAAWLGRALASAGYHSGLTHTRFVRTGRGFEIVDVATRMGGAMTGPAVNVALGLNYHGAAVDLALGRRPRVLDEPRTVRLGVGSTALYAPHPGVFDRVVGADALRTHPGAPRVLPLKRSGEVVPSITDQRGVVAFVVADGPTAELSLHHATSAAAQLTIAMLG